MAEHLTWTIGDVRVTRVEEVIVPIPWASAVPAGEQHLDRCRPWIDPYLSDSRAEVLFSIHSFVIETPDNLIVVDTCIGDSGEFAFPGDSAFGDRLLDALPGGFDAVTVVVCTHLHFDHVGWNTIEVDGEFQPRFVNARHLVTQAELNSVRDEEDSRSYARSIEPLGSAGLLDAVEMGHVIDEWVALESSPGHTPGHVGVRISDGDNNGIITGDLVHTPLQFAHPDASSASDNDPAQAIDTRVRFVADVLDTETLVLGSHFAPPTAGHIRTTDEGSVQFG